MKTIFLKFWFTTILFTLCGLTAYAQTPADSIDISKYEQYIEDDGNLLDANGIIKPLGIFTTTEIPRIAIDSLLMREGYSIEPQEPNYYHSYNYFLNKNNYKEIKEYCVNISNQENSSARIHWCLKLYDSKIHSASLTLFWGKDSKGKTIKKKKIIKSLLKFYKEKGTEIRKYKHKYTFLSGKKGVDKGYELIYNGHYIRLIHKGHCSDIAIVYNCNKYYTEPYL